MSQIITFEKFPEAFNELDTDNICIDELKDSLYEFLPSLFNYEEEGEKLNFNILIIQDFGITSKKLASFLFQELITIKKSKLNLKKHIKSLAPFSKNGWSIFISLESDSYLFGVYKDFSGIESVPLTDLLKNKYIEISKVDKDIITFENNNNLLYLHLSIIVKDISINRKSNVLELINMATCSIEENENIPVFKKNFSNFLFQAFEKIHGTIIVVVDNNEKLADYFDNGIILKTPINLFDEYINYIQNCSKDDRVIQRYYSLIGLLAVSLDIDGITILNTNSEIIAYNVFIDNPLCQDSCPKLMI